MMWSYLLESWIWSVGGLIFGYVWGRTERELRDLTKRNSGRRGDDNDDT